MTAAHSQLRDLGLPPRDAEQTELHPDLNRAHVRFINLGKTYDGSVHALQGIDLAASFPSSLSTTELIC